MRVDHQILLAALLAAPTAVAAQAPAAPPAPKRIEFTGDISFVTTTGNTSITTMGGAEKLIFRPDEKWMFTQGAKVIYGTSKGDVNAENYYTGLRADYAFSPRTGAYALMAFDRNVFSGIAARYEYSAGLIAKLWETEKDKLQFEVGIARISQRATNDTTTYFFSSRTAGVYRHNFSGASYLDQRVELLPNLQEASDLRLLSLTSLVAPVSSHIGLKASYQVRWDGLPQPGFEETDTEFRTGIQVTF
jgi:putative salt-induced outer membrane protein YdiY